MKNKPSKIFIDKFGNTVSPYDASIGKLHPKVKNGKIKIIKAK